MIGRLYSVSVGPTTLSAADSMLEFTSASTAVTTIERIWVTNEDFDTSENSVVVVERMSIAGTLGTTETPHPFELGSTACGGVVESGLTEGTPGVELMRQGFNVLSGFLWTPANDDEVFVLDPSGIAQVRLDAATTSMDFAYGATIREIGT